MNAAVLFERVVRAAVRRPWLVVAITLALAAGGGLWAALTVRPNTGIDTLVSSSDETFQATQKLHDEFGDDAIVVLVRGDLAKLVLTADIQQLIKLEGCLSGNVPPNAQPYGGKASACGELADTKPVRVVYGPGTFINESVSQISSQFAKQQALAAQQAQQASLAARKLAAARGASRAQQAKVAREAAQLVQTEFQRNVLQLALRYGITSVPRLNDPRFVADLVFDPARTEPGCAGRTPKSRFSYLFPNCRAAIIQVRLNPGLSEAERRAAISQVRAVVGPPPAGACVGRPESQPVSCQVRLANGGSYLVTGAPIVLADLTSQISDSIVVLIVAALIVMAATLMLVFRSRPRLLPLAVAVAATGLTFGALAAVGGSLTIASLAVLPVLIGLAVDYAIQFQSRIEEIVEVDRLEASEAAPRAAALGAPTIATAALATSVGFLVLLIPWLSPIPMVRGFGLLLVVGIVLAFICALTAGSAAFVLAHGAVEKPRRPRGRRIAVPEALAAAWRGARELVSGALSFARRVAARAVRFGLSAGQAQPRRVLAVALAVALLGWVASFFTPVVSDITKLVPQGTPALRDLRMLEKDTGVSGEIDVLVSAPDLTQPRVIRWMSAYQQSLLHHYGYSAQRGCGSAALCPALSLPDLFRADTKSLSQANIRTLLDAVPPYFSQAVISSDRKLTTLAFGIRLGPLDAQQRVIDEMRSRLHPPPGVHAQLAGLPVLAAQADSAVSSPWRRLLQLIAGLLAVGLVLLAVTRRLAHALVPLVPIVLATGWSALVAFCLTIPLNPMSVTLGALVIAISTEFSVLLSARYRQERGGGHDVSGALQRAYRSTGAAVLASGATAIAGFAVLVVSDIRMLREFGAVTVIDLAVALAGVIVVLPAVLVMAERRKT